MSTQRKTNWSGLLALVGVTLLGNSVASAQAVPNCSKPVDRVAHAAGATVGGAIVRQAWREVNRDPDRFDELVDRVSRALPTPILPTKKKLAIVKCAAHGLGQGVADAFDEIQAAEASECLLDGQAWGEVAASLYCALSQVFKASDVPGLLPMVPDRVCGTTYEETCMSSFAGSAKALCKKYSKGPAFETSQDISCIPDDAVGCGNGRIDAGETCDDGNTVGGDGCDATCQSSGRCGDGVVQVGEQCDDGNSLNSDACSNVCKSARCGDAIVNQMAEQCDDGNTVNTDACSNSCTTPRCGDSIVNQASEQCDDGNTVNTDACSNSCTSARCGDSIVNQASEQCDDGNTVNTDSCSNSCTVVVAPRCGDGIVNQASEQCDDGNTAAGDGCENNCTRTPVGGDIPNQAAACRSCRASQCTNFQGLGFDFVAACFADPDPAFVQQCIDVKNCAFVNDCGYNANGLFECFCGTADASACQTAGAANGPCQAEIFAASRTTALADVIGNFGDISLPIGVANYLLQCDTESCLACQ